MFGAPIAKWTEFESRSRRNLLNRKRINLLKNIMNFTTADDWDCAFTVKSLSALHHSVDFIF